MLPSHCAEGQQARFCLPPGRGFTLLFLALHRSHALPILTRDFGGSLNPGFRGGLPSWISLRFGILQSLSACLLSLDTSEGARCVAGLSRIQKHRSMRQLETRRLSEFVHTSNSASRAVSDSPAAARSCPDTCLFWSGKKAVSKAPRRRISLPHLVIHAVEICKGECAGSWNEMRNVRWQHRGRFANGT
jgi:hypothetical protein